MARFRGLFARGMQFFGQSPVGDGPRGLLVRKLLLSTAAGFFLSTVSCGVAQEPASLPAGKPTASAEAASARGGTPPQIAGLELSKAEARIQDALNSLTSIQLIDVPLEEVAVFLSKYHDIPIQLDMRALEDAGISADLPITFEVSGIKLRNALALMLGKHDLGAHYRHEALFISTRDVLNNEVTTQVYPIMDLLGQDPDGESETWEEIIQSTISPVDWDVQGGAGAVAAYRGRLVVTNSEEIHREIHLLLTAMRKYKQAAKEAAGKPLPTAFWLEEEGRSPEAWNAVLAKQLEIEFLETPLSDVAEFFSDKLGVPVKLDEQALEASGIPLDLPISYRQRDVSVRAALSAMLPKHDLQWVIKNEVLLLTTIDVANHEVQTRIYPVADLVRTSDGTLDSWQLIEVLQMTVLPETWDTQGGPGVVTPSPNEDALLITVTEESHQQIAALFAKLRKTAGQNAADQGGEPKPVEKPDHSRRLKVFEQFGGLDFAPLADVAREMFEPNLWPAHEGDDGASPVLAAVPTQLVVRHEKAFIDLIEDFLNQAYTAGSFSQRHFDRTPVFELGESGPLMVRCYRLPPIVEAPAVGSEGKPADTAKAGESPNEVPRPGQPYEPLVRELVLPDSWGEAGPGRVRGLPGLLVVRHTPEGQREVAKLLEKLIGPLGPGSGGNFF